MRRWLAILLLLMIFAIVIYGAWILGGLMSNQARSINQIRSKNSLIFILSSEYYY